MRVAVLGAGLTGLLAALGIAEGGAEVLLFDRHPRPFMGASGACEGKIHLGYVYAMDPSLATARQMIRGAAAFRPLVERWTGPEPFERHASRGFVYAVPRGSMLPLDGIAGHIAAVAAEVGEAPGLGPAAARWRPLAAAELEALFDPAEVLGAFETAEVALDVNRIGAALREALASAPRIRTLMGAEVLGVGCDGAAYVVEAATAAGPLRERVDAVVNALWEERLHIDRTLGLEERRPIVHRYKLGLWTRSPGVLARLPAVTFLTGAFGDTVAFRDSAYVSWYPAGLLSQEVAIRPSAPPPRPDAAQGRAILAESLANLRRLMPGAAEGLAEDQGWELRGGYVTAWGRSGIEDAGSELHLRRDVGVRSRGRYHSVDTGKLTTAPLFAREASLRALGTA